MSRNKQVKRGEVAKGTASVKVRFKGHPQGEPITDEQKSDVPMVDDTAKLEETKEPDQVEKALDKQQRKLIKEASQDAVNNKRK